MKTSIDWFVIKAVRKKRKALKMTQAELSFRLGRANGFVGQVESKKTSTKYNLVHLNSLAKIFDCSIREFFPEKYLE